MNMDRDKRRAALSWLLVGTLLVLCGVLGVLQYRWIGEVSMAERDRLRWSLQTSLNRLSQDFNGELTAACRALLPANTPGEPETAETDITANYGQWKKTARHARMLRAIAVARPDDGEPVLRMMDLKTGVFSPAEWPEAWTIARQRLEARMSPEMRRQNRMQRMRMEDAGPVFELLLAAWPPPGAPPPGNPPGPFARRGIAWLIVEFDVPYLRDSVLPELLQRHFGGDGAPDYQVEVVTRANPSAMVYHSHSDSAARIAGSADASAGLFDLQYERLFRRGGQPGPRERPPGQMRRPADFDSGRWQISIRHRAGSVDAAVTRTRRRNLAVTGGILLLMVASVGALVSFTRRAQKLAELQMDFVAGVSHELRTPLTVIHTAAFNLRGRVTDNPRQVARYGALIQQESERLKEIVEQVLRFARAKSGRVIQQPEPLSLQPVIDDVLAGFKQTLQESGCVVERNIEPGLPGILGDPVALRQALQNLIGNAVKYGTKGGNWIGVSAAKAGGDVEIRVADRGPGIPEDERERIFDPFFRGRRALQDQIHGTGLGLNLVRKIVEAHGGSIRVNSEPMKGSEFIVRIPAAPPEHEDEFADSVGRG